MEKPEHLENDLEGVDPEVAAFGVGEFVEEDGEKVIVLEVLEGFGGHQNSWSEESSKDRAGEAGELIESDPFRKANSLVAVVEQLKYSGIGDSLGMRESFSNSQGVNDQQ